MSLPNFSRIPLALPSEASEPTAAGAGLEHRHGLPGFAPFVRGPHPTLYAAADWAISQDGRTTVAAVVTDRGRSVLIDLAQASPVDIGGVADLLASPEQDTVFVGLSGLTRAPVARQLTETLSAAVACLRAAVSADVGIDQVAPRLGVWLDVGADYFTEIAKIRAARLIWAETVRREGGADPRFQALRTHGRIAAADAGRATVAGLAATAGQVHSLDVVATQDEPSLRSMPAVLTAETGLNRVIDPWGGSRHVERLTHELADQARGLMAGTRRDEAAVQAALAALAAGDANRMTLSIEAGRLGATPAEIATALA